MADDRNAPATKGDVHDLKGDVDHLRTDLEDFKVEVNTRFTAFEHRLEQLLLEMEGRIITSNYRLAESIQVRLTQEEHESAALKNRLAIIEERPTDVERRINMPPRAGA